jgi:hypothetical protein
MWYEATGSRNSTTCSRSHETVICRPCGKSPPSAAPPTALPLTTVGGAGQCATVCVHRIVHQPMYASTSTPPSLVATDTPLWMSDAVSMPRKQGDRDYLGCCGLGMVVLRLPVVRGAAGPHRRRGGREDSRHPRHGQSINVNIVNVRTYSCRYWRWRDTRGSAGSLYCRTYGTGSFGLLKYESPFFSDFFYTVA